MSKNKAIMCWNMLTSLHPVSFRTVQYNKFIKWGQWRSRSDNQNRRPWHCPHRGAPRPWGTADREAQPGPVRPWGSVQGQNTGDSRSSPGNDPTPKPHPSCKVKLVYSILSLPYIVSLKMLNYLTWHYGEFCYFFFWSEKACKLGVVFYDFRRRWTT